MTEKSTAHLTAENCNYGLVDSNYMLPIRDALNVLEGKWKIPIVASLFFSAKRFKEISRDLDGISDKVLSTELKDLESNKIISRMVFDTFPPKVEYTLTEHGKSLSLLIEEVMKWGQHHRKAVIGG
jgi:DNA-binding HxlR family transcriptional regulator